MRISDWRSDVCSSDLERFAVESASLPDPFFRGAWWPDCPQRRSRPDLVARREEPPCDQRQGQVQRGEQAAAQRQRGLRLRSEERRVGTAVVSTRKSRWSPYN